MKTDKLLKNSIAAVCSYILVAVLSFFVRRLFLANIDDVFLGYEGFFNNVFEVLTVLGLGIDSVILYKMMKCYGEEDAEGINALFNIYKSFLRYLIIFVSILSLMIFFACVFVFKLLDNNYIVFLVFLILLVQFVFQFGINLYRIILVVVQEDYKFFLIDFIIQFICGIIKIFLILSIKSYVLYLLVTLLGSVLTMVLVYRKVWTRFNEYVVTKTVTNDQYIRQSVIADLKQNVVQKISLAIYGGTDNILVTILWGVNLVSKLSNFYLITKAIDTGLCKIFDSFQPAIGNMIYSNSNTQKKAFESLNFIGFVVGINMFVFSCVGINSFIYLFFGSKYPIDSLFVLFFALNTYITWNHKFVVYFRNSFGHYEIDRNYILVGTVLNIILSIFISLYIGVAGIILGTVIGHIGFWIGRVIVVHRLYIKESIGKYLLIQFKYLCILFVEYIFVHFVFSVFPNTWVGYITNLVFAFLGCNVIVALGLAITGELTKSVSYIKNIASLIKQ